MRIWIDLANSPQVLFFRPIVRELEARGHTVRMTSRHFAQTTQLADQLGFAHVPIGGHGGKRLSRIGLSVAQRAWALAAFARGQSFDLAVSHNSYAQAVASRALGIPFVTSMDYEHQPANHLCFRLARRVIVPQSFPQAALATYGATPAKTRYYQGVKEQLYLADFSPSGNYLASIGIDANATVVVMRPPGSWGLYHNFDNPLFDRVLAHVAAHRDVVVVFLPRVASQADAVRAHGYANVIVPETALEGPNLLHHADLVISGGGTMNREAAVLGTPTYSVFQGKPAAVDRYLIDRGRLRQIATEADIPAIHIHKKPPSTALPGTSLVTEIAAAILE
jgi:predicted glycosyltransferase